MGQLFSTMNRKRTWVLSVEKEIIETIGPRKVVRQKT